MTEEEPIPHIFASKRNRVSLGLVFLVLGIAGALVTYKYMFPIGSIILTVCGLTLIFFWQRWMNFVREKIHGR